MLFAHKNDRKMVFVVLLMLSVHHTHGLYQPNELKLKARDSYIERLLIGKSQWCCGAKRGRPLHVLTSNWTHSKQPANTPLSQSTTPGLHPISIHQMASSEHTSDCSSLLIYRPRKDERLSWLTCTGWFIHITGHSSDAGRVQDRKSSPAKDRGSTTVPRHQPNWTSLWHGAYLGQCCRYHPGKLSVIFYIQYVCINFTANKYHFFIVFWYRRWFSFLFQSLLFRSHLQQSSTHITEISSDTNTFHVAKNELLAKLREC